MDIKTLATGEQVWGVAHLAYGLFNKDDGTQEIRAAYNPNRQDIASLCYKQFTSRESNYGVNITQEMFIEFIKDVDKHWRQISELNRETYSAKTSTPWGQSDYAKRYTRGITFYGTPGHGGFKVSNSLNSQIPDYMRNDKGWYEEDEAWAVVASVFPDYFTDKEKKNAEETLRNCRPGEYEKFYGVTLSADQSVGRAREEFEKNTADKWVVISANSSDERPEMVEVWATVGGKRQAWNGPAVEEKRFWIPKNEYNTRSAFGFVVDPARHEEMTLLAANLKP